MTVSLPSALAAATSASMPPPPAAVVCVFQSTEPPPLELVEPHAAITTSAATASAKRWNRRQFIPFSTKVTDGGPSQEHGVIRLAQTAVRVVRKATAVGTGSAQ